MVVSTGGGTVRVDLTEPPTYPYNQKYDEGTIIALEAVPSFGYVFDGWGGHISGADNPMFITMDCNKRVTASFSVNWRFYGTFFGSLALVLFFVSVLFFRRKAPSSTTPEISEETNTDSA